MERNETMENDQGNGENQRSLHISCDLVLHRALFEQSKCTHFFFINNHRTASTETLKLITSISM